MSDWKAFESELSQAHAGMRGTRIMVVDDDPGIAAMISEMLLSQGAETTVVSDSLDALARISQECVELVTVDLMMPGIDGIEFCKRVRAAHPTIGVIIISGARDVPMAVEAMKLGALDYISKPFELETVTTVVSRALKETRHRRLEQQAAQNRSGGSPKEDTEGLLEALVTALDAREHETKNHSRRVTCYALLLGQTMKMDQAELEVLRQGAILHDIGKIGIPDDILLKTGPLNHEEWELMRKHPAIAYRILGSIDDLKPAAEIILAHHERFEGGGYPRGLKEFEIPLGARIFSLADTLDAITSERPYRRGCSFEAAADEIARNSATQFDPAVVAAFMRVPLDAWIALRAQTLLDSGPLATIPGADRIVASLPLSAFNFHGEHQVQ